jgi:hypothetical protein
MPHAFAPLALAATLLLAAGPAAAAADSKEPAPLVVPTGGRTPEQEISDLRERLATAENRIDALLFGLGLAGATGLLVGRLAARRQRRQPRHDPLADDDESTRPAPLSHAPTTPQAVTVASVFGPSPSAYADQLSTDAAPHFTEMSTLPPAPAAMELADTPRTDEAHEDVDQQAEFLMVLGQDEAAIDLLRDHLRGTGGTSPLPYVRLMQIYRARGDEPAYERTRERFNQRFNALAPAWDGVLAEQRGLEDYPAVLGRLQRGWRRTLDSRTLLETLLFRRGSEDERFDLPAYEELIFLHGLTRDLLRRGGQPDEPVDVLLPMDEEEEALSVIQAVTRPPSQREQRAASAFLSSTVEPADEAGEKAGEGVDLDLSTAPADPRHTLSG